MDIDKCHLCRTRQPLDAATFDMTTNTVKKSFKGEIGITLHAASLYNKAGLRSMVGYILGLKHRMVDIPINTGFVIDQDKMMAVSRLNLVTYKVQ